MGGCLSEVKTRLNRISYLDCSQELGDECVYQNKGELVVPVVNGAAS